MKTIRTCGQIQVADVTWDEFHTLNFKYLTASTLVFNATQETVSFIRVWFNKKGQVTRSKAFLKDTNSSTSLFKKEAIRKDGQLTEYAIKTLNEIFVK
ncbi:TPA: hypothetical protein U1V47_001951 [Streptococcus suis]|uniref:Uncharacterized protein n=1 Tax=Streptococcus suis TaxID=1307 RepID=A0A0Z8NED0_STRSU|nr:hypothetical protein [Streptococcus suis]NQG45861.1 hypothetical protein [Streptococcus suis]NQG70276.1 hypothetical protein [Streptococcus suis]NQH63362.1 hypothetical protein [Streptococcus suis]NQS05863.1 hypothetical protein [Streptococcus suis]CYU52199.1 Uncharacterised protein [Streptococcus suis]